MYGITTEELLAAKVVAEDDFKKEYPIELGEDDNLSDDFGDTF